MDADAVVVSLRRPTTDKSWGFTLQGGIDQRVPVFVQKIGRNGIAHKAGLEPGDVIIKICETFVGGFTHDKVKAEILRAGNELDFTVKKHAFNLASYNPAQATGVVYAGNAATVPAGGARSADPHSEIVEEHVWKHGGPKFKNVQPKSYKILEQQLPQSEQGGANPGSIFDRHADERSGYLKATNNSIQKVYGEQ